MQRTYVAGVLGKELSAACALLMISTASWLTHAMLLIAQVCIGEALAALHSYARDCARRQQLERRQLLGGHGGGGAGGGAGGAIDVEEDLGAQAYGKMQHAPYLAEGLIMILFPGYVQGFTSSATDRR